MGRVWCKKLYGLTPMCDLPGYSGWTLTLEFIKFLFSGAPSHIEPSILKPNLWSKSTPCQKAVLTSKPFRFLTQMNAHGYEQFEKRFLKKNCKMLLASESSSLSWHGDWKSLKPKSWLVSADQLNFLWFSFHQKLIHPVYFE